MTYVWHDAYRTAVLETDWMRLIERIQSAEMEIYERQRVLSLDHGGSLEERQAIADALHGMRVLRTELHDWQECQMFAGGVSDLRNC